MSIQNCLVYCRCYRQHGRELEICNPIRYFKDSCLYFTLSCLNSRLFRNHGDDGRQANIRASVISTHLSTAICHVTYAWSCPRLNLCVKISRLAPLRQQERIFISHSAHSLPVCNYTSHYVLLSYSIPVLLSPSLSFSS